MKRCVWVMETVVVTTDYWVTATNNFFRFAFGPCSGGQRPRGRAGHRDFEDTVPQEDMPADDAASEEVPDEDHDEQEEEEDDLSSGDQGQSSNDADDGNDDDPGDAADAVAEVLGHWDAGGLDDHEPAAAERASEAPDAAANAEAEADAAAAHGGDLLARLDLHFVRAPGVPELRFELPPGHGELRYSITGDFLRAHCAEHEDCTRQRATRKADEDLAGRSAIAYGQGRPIGALYAWLCSAKQYKTKKDRRSVALLNMFNLREGTWLRSRCAYI